MKSTHSETLRLLPAVIAMALVIFVSNVLVQMPVERIVELAGYRIDLAELLTWGAFTYPIAFLVTDTTNRLFGMRSARRVVYVGFACGVALSLSAAFSMASVVASTQDISLLAALTSDEEAFSMLRIALASGSAFLLAQLLDIVIFDKLRAASWWKAPAVSSLFGSLSDTAIFFSLAFAGSGLPWVNWALGDFTIKLLMIAALLYPFRLLVNCYPAHLRTTAS